MKKEIVVIGAGKIGRGSLGLFFTRAGWKVDFFGHNPVKMAELAAQGYYETRTETGVTSRVEGFEVLDCSTDEALIEKLREVDLCACALYANAFADVGIYLAKATKARMADGNEGPLNVMLCVNDPTAIDQIEASMNPLLTEEEQAWRREHIALCFTITLSNGSLPLPDDNPWLVLVSDYPSLQIDEGPWLGEKLENIPPIIYTTNGKAKVFHKVYIGNMSHAMHAYIGSALGMDYLDEGIMENEWAQYNIAKAREEATLAVTSEFTFSDYELNEWENEPPMSAKVQHDPFSRIGNSPEKKAGYNERYIWPARMCLKHGRLPYYLCMGAAYCLFYIVTGHGKQPVERPTNEEEVRALVERFCGLGDEDFIVRDLVVAQYCAIPEAGIIPTEK